VRSFRPGGVTLGIHDPFNVRIRFLNVSARKQEQLAQLIVEVKEPWSAFEEKQATHLALKERHSR